MDHGETGVVHWDQRLTDDELFDLYSARQPGAKLLYDAYFQGRPNGAFSFVALRALAKLPAKATYSDWFKAIRKVLPSQQYPQSPNLYSSSSMKRWKVLA